MVNTIKDNPITTILFIVIMLGSVVSTFKMFTDESLAVRVLALEVKMEICSRKIDMLDATTTVKLESMERVFSTKIDILTKQIDRLTSRLEASNVIHGNDLDNSGSLGSWPAYVRYSGPNESLAE